MSPPRLFVPDPLLEGATVPLDRARAHYLRDVMRLRTGAPVHLFNGIDGEWLAILGGDRKAAVLEIGQRRRAQAVEPGPVLLFAPIKRPRLEWLLEKAVELGVARLVPVLTERTVVRPESSERLRARVIEAAEQCERLTVPALDDPADLLGAVDALPSGELLAFADEQGGGVPAIDLFREQPVTALLIGPEGGFTPAERKALLARARIRAVSLGPRILRAETAALHALACWGAVAASGR
jgi:16S rRNA (uracil1498-N3)-methyltransferase